MVELLSVIGVVYSSVIRDIARQGKPTSKRASKGGSRGQKAENRRFSSVVGFCKLRTYPLSTRCSATGARHDSDSETRNCHGTMADNLHGPCRLSRADGRRDPTHHEERGFASASCAVQCAGGRCGLAQGMRRIPGAAPASGGARLRGRSDVLPRVRPRSRGRCGGVAAGRVRTAHLAEGGRCRTRIPGRRENTQQENRSRRFRAGWPQLHTNPANFTGAARGDRQPLAETRPVDAGGSGNLAEIRAPGFQWAANGRVCGGGRHYFGNDDDIWSSRQSSRVWGGAGDGLASSESHWRFSPKSFTEAPVPG